MRSAFTINQKLLVIGRSSVFTLRMVDCLRFTRSATATPTIKGNQSGTLGTYSESGTLRRYKVIEFRLRTLPLLKKVFASKHSTFLRYIFTFIVFGQSSSFFFGSFCPDTYLSAQPPALIDRLKSRLIWWLGKKQRSRNSTWPWNPVGPYPQCFELRGTDGDWYAA